MKILGVALADAGLTIRIQDGDDVRQSDAQDYIDRADTGFVARCRRFEVASAVAWCRESLAACQADLRNWAASVYLNAYDAKRPASHAKHVIEASDQYREHQRRIDHAQHLLDLATALQAIITTENTP